VIPAGLPVESDSDATALLPRAAPGAATDAESIRLLVSACLLGDKVRYDGQHKYGRPLRGLREGVHGRSRGADHGEEGHRRLAYMLGFFKKQLCRDEKAELLETIEAYRRSLVPLIAPLTLIKQCVRKYQVSYLARVPGRCSCLRTRPS
jgi:hypothetical protein